MTSRPETLAIHGGIPVRATPMPPRRAIGDEERRMIAECLDYYDAKGEDPGYQGVFEERYCDTFTGQLGGGYADAVATGTVALYIAIAALDLPKGSQVLCSPITDPGTLSAIILNGLVPRLADAQPGRYGMSADQVRERLSPEVSAVMVVHSLGQACDIDAITAEAHRSGVKVIEDCSQSHGALWNGKPVGSFGDIAAFSTMYRKAHVTGPCGGVVYTRNKDLYHQALAHADRGKPRWIEGFDDRDPAGFLFPALNLHAGELSCAIGISSLSRLDHTIARRRAFVAGLCDAIRAESIACTPHPNDPGDSPFVHPIAVDTSRLTCSKLDFAKAVRAEGIGLNPHYAYLATDWPYLKPYLADTFDTPNARASRDASFCLYLNENYGPQEVADCIAAIRKVEAAYLA